MVEQIADQVRTFDLSEMCLLGARKAYTFLTRAGGEQRRSVRFMSLRTRWTKDKMPCLRALERTEFLQLCRSFHQETRIPPPMTLMITAKEMAGERWKNEAPSIFKLTNKSTITSACFR
jgi:hypothetical protein